MAAASLADTSAVFPDIPVTATISGPLRLGTDFAVSRQASSPVGRTTSGAAADAVPLAPTYSVSTLHSAAGNLTRQSTSAALPWQAAPQPSTVAGAQPSTLAAPPWPEEGQPSGCTPTAKDQQMEPTPPGGGASEQWRLLQLKRELEALDSLLSPRVATAPADAATPTSAQRTEAAPAASDAARKMSPARGSAGARTPAVRVQGSPPPAAVLGEMRRVEQLERELAAVTDARRADAGRARSALTLLRHGAPPPPSAPGFGSQYALCVQSVVEQLEPIAAEGGAAGDDAAERALAEHGAACARIAALSSPSGDPGTDVDKLREGLVNHELAAAAAESLRRQQTKKVVALTQQLCEKEGTITRLEDTLRVKQQQIRSMQDTLSTTGSKLSELTQHHKQHLTMQESFQLLQEQVAGLEEAVAARDKELAELRPHALARRAAEDQAQGAANMLAALQLQTKHLTEERDEIQAVGEAQEKVLREQRTELAHMRGEMQSLEGQLRRDVNQSDEFRVAARRANAQQADLEARLREADRAKAAAEAELPLLQSAVDAAAARERDALDEVQRAEARRQAAEEEAAALAVQLNDLRGTLRLLQEGGEETAKEAERLRDTNAALRAGADASREAVAEARAKLRESELARDEAAARARLAEGAVADRDAAAARRSEEMERRLKDAERTARSAEQQRAAQEADRVALEDRAGELQRREAAVAATERQLASLEEALVQRQAELGVSAVTDAVNSSRIAELTQLLEGEEKLAAELRCRAQSVEKQLRCAEERRGADTDKLHATVRTMEMVRGQLNDNTEQFCALAKELHSAQTRAAEESSLREGADERAQKASDEAARLEARARELASEVQRLASCVDMRSLELQQREALRSEELQQLRQSNLELAEQRQLAAAGQEAARMNGDLAQKRAAELRSAEQRCDETRKELADAVEHLRVAQRDLGISRAAADDAARHAANLRSAIGRLGRRFEECEARWAEHARGRAAEVQQVEDAQSFMRYVRGWWSMHRDDTREAAEAPPPAALLVASPPGNPLPPPPPPPLPGAAAVPLVFQRSVVPALGAPLPPPAPAPSLDMVASPHRHPRSPLM